MSIRLRTKKLIWSGVIGASLMLVSTVAGGYFIHTKSVEREQTLKKQYQAELAIMNDTVQQNEEGYALLQDLNRGEPITEEMLVKVTLPSAAKSEDAIEVIEFSNFDYFARTDLKANTILVESLVYVDLPIENDVREAEYAFIDLPTKLKTDDFADIRIQFPNGDDYVLLSKKRVKDVAGMTIWVHMDEGELLTMSSAIVDAYIEEAKIYALPYVDGSMQIGSEMTYPVKKNVLELIKDSPNLVNIAKLNLENQNRQRLESGLKEMGKEQREAVRQKEQEYKNSKSQDDKERALIEMNQSTIYEDEEIVNGSIGEGADE